MLESTSKDDWLQEHEWLIHELLHEARKLAQRHGKVDGATQRCYDMALQALLAHARNVDPRQLVVEGRGGVGTIPYLLYAQSRAEVHALRRAAESRPNLPKLSRADTKALWHAVQAQRMLIEDLHAQGYARADLAAERANLDAARAALRKVNAVRKGQAAGTARSAGGPPP